MAQINIRGRIRRANDGGQIEEALTLALNDLLQTQYIDGDVISRNTSTSDNPSVRMPKNNPWIQEASAPDHDNQSDKASRTSDDRQRVTGEVVHQKPRFRVEQTAWCEWKARKDLLPGRNKKLKQHGILIDYTTRSVNLLMPEPKSVATKNHAASFVVSLYRSVARFLGTPIHYPDTTNGDEQPTAGRIRDNQCDHCRRMTYELGTVGDPGSSKKKIKSDEGARDILQMVQATEAGCLYCSAMTKLVIATLRQPESELEGLTEEHEQLGNMVLMRPVRRIQLDAPRIVLWDRYLNVRTSGSEHSISLQKLSQLCNTKTFKDIEVHPRHGFDLYLLREETNLPSELSGRQIYGSPTEPGAVFLAREWLQMCQSNHKYCSSPSNGLPARLIDVGSESRSPRLITTRTGAAGVYAALSYCWGSGVPLVTTLDSFKDRQKAILIKDMPATIRDAVLFTRLLQIPYLWVDALCVIQDSAQDWAEQSAEMATVYSNALVTLAALDATSTADGFLISRNIDLPHPQIEVQIEGDHGGKAYTNKKKVLLRPQYPFHNIFNRPSHLHARAWCLQECLLSERTIYFQYDQMFWQCSECWLREGDAAAGAENAHDVVDTLKMRAEYRNWRDCCLKRPSPRFTDVARASEVPRKDRYVIWHTMVKEFQARQITRHSDKLPAMAGLAYAFQCANQDDYYAGLWKSDMHHGLLWAVKPNRRGLPYPSLQSKALDTESLTASCLPPTWSWAATSHAIIYPGTGLSSISWNTVLVLEHKLCTIENVQTNLSTASIFGHVNGGKLQLRGPFQSVNQANITSLTKSPGKVEWWLDNGVYGRADFQEWEDFDCVLIGIVNGSPIGLVLSKVLESGCYRRTGVVRFSYVEHKEPWDWLKAWVKDHSLSII